MSNENKKPDYNISVLCKDTSAKGRVGVAWKQNDGSIQIVLDPMVTLYGQGLMANGEKVYITLWPVGWKKTDKVEDTKSTKPPIDDLGDDIPF